MLTITEIKTPKYLLLSVMSDNDDPISWEKLQSIKEDRYPGKVFFEVYPSSKNVVNNVNQRHLYHVPKLELPCLTELELEQNFVFL
jgi:hypothetical protein